MSNIVNQKDIKQLINADDVFGQIRTQYGLPPNWYRPPGFTNLSKIILGQQVSLESANAHFLKLSSYLPAFTPDEIIKLSDEDMRQCQISRQKSKYLRSLSSAILDERIDLKALPKLSYREVREKLKTVNGIGDWTVDIYLMFCLRAKDIFPNGDIAVITSIKELSNAVTKDEIMRRSENWKPYRSLAAFFLWHYYLKKRKRNSML